MNMIYTIKKWKILRKINYIQRRSGILLKWIHINGVMNVFVVRIYSIVDSIIHAFSSSLRPFDPKRRVSTIIKYFSFNFFLWFEQFEQWTKNWIVVSICLPQLQNGSRESWELCPNLRSRKWLSPTRNFVSSLIPWELCTLNVLLGLALLNLRISLLKAPSDSEFWILLSSSFHSITVDGKKEFRKYSCLTLNKAMLLWFLVVHVDKTLEIISKR